MNSSVFLGRDQMQQKNECSNNNLKIKYNQPSIRMAMQMGINNYLDKDKDKDKMIKGKSPIEAFNPTFSFAREMANEWNTETRGVDMATAFCYIPPPPVLLTPSPLRAGKVKSLVLQLISIEKPKTGAFFQHHLK